MIKDDCEEYFSQKQMIKDFVENFYKRHGYKPIVVSKASIDDAFEVDVMTLEELIECFTPFLPKLYGKTLPLTARSRLRDLVELRQMYCYIARTMGYRLVNIGKALKQADHSTAIYSIQMFRNMMQTEPRYRARFSHILNHIKQKSYESSIMADGNTVENNS